MQRQRPYVSTCLSHTWVYPALWGHYGRRGSSLQLGPESLWPSLRGYQVPLHGQSCTVGGREQAGRSGQAKAEPEGPSATCLDALPPIVSSGLAIGQEGQVGQARKQKRFLWLYCCPFLPSTLPGLPHCLIAGCPGPPGSISCCRPEPDTSYPLHHGPAQPPAS